MLCLKIWGLPAVGPLTLGLWQGRTLYQDVQDRISYIFHDGQETKTEGKRLGTHNPDHGYASNDLIGRKKKKTIL